MEDGVKTPVGELKPSVRAYTVKDLGKSEPHYFYSGLLSLTCCILREISSRNNKYYLNMTGGFKPESAYATAVAMMRVPQIEAIYYVHESFRDLVLLPILATALRGDEALGKMLTKHPYDEYYSKALGGKEKVREFAEKLVKCIKGSYLECKKPLKAIC